MLSERTNYWNLGISINKETRHTIQRPVDIDRFYSDSYPQYKKALNEPVFTLETNYLVSPQEVSADSEPQANNHNIKALIVNGQYFEAAKQILFIEDSRILSEFNDLNDFYYWSSFVYYNLGNQLEAYNNISMIESRDSYPEILFLEALILESLGERDSSENTLKQIINDFPDNDYSSYSKNILLEN